VTEVALAGSDRELQMDSRQSSPAAQRGADMNATEEMQAGIRSLTGNAPVPCAKPRAAKDRWISGGLSSPCNTS